MKNASGAMFLLALAMAGCPLDESSDGGDHPKDLIGPECAPLLQNLQATLSATQTCQLDSDCAIDMLPCGLVGQCFAPVTTSNATEIDSLVTSLEQDQCAATGSICSCPAIGTAVCVSGVCQNQLEPDPTDAGPASVCNDLVAQFDTIVDNTQVCSSDSDCTIDLFPCGVVGQCFAAVSNATAGQLSPIVSQLEADDCGANSGVCSCPAIGAAACVAGVCQNTFGGTDGGSDGGPPPIVDGCGIAGFDGGSCGGLVDQFASLVQTAQPCATQSDCVMDVFGCGIVDGCAAAVTATTQAELTALVSHLTEDQCIDTTDPCSCPAIGSAACVAGFCQSSLDGGFATDAGP